MTGKLNVCFITEDFYPQFIGGQGVWGRYLVYGLSKTRKVQLTVLAEKKRGREAFWKSVKKVRLILTPFCFGNQLILSFFEYLYFTFTLYNSYFDILHVNQLSGLFFILFRPKNVRKIIISAHNTNFDMYKEEKSKLKRLLYLPLIWIERMVYKKADAILFNSEDERKDLINYFNLRNKTTRSVYPGTRLQKISATVRKKEKLKIRKKLNLKKDTKLVLYVGRLVKRKNVDMLIKAIEIAGKKNTKIKGLIIGDGMEKNRLKKIAAKDVLILGFVKYLKPYFLASDVFATISVAEGGVVLTALMAASYGLPLILSPSAGGNRIIEDKKNGYIVSEKNPEEIARKILLAVEHSKQMGRVSYKKAKLLSWKRTVNETLEFYQSLLGRL